ncbi:MAG: hypothetical protein OEX00_08860 [Gammaproteobacteria bacterium]|nr:hypothetical protein [Gammaproteobacteria bacterium]MDH5691486.1 hypothetical protein [Gammaproteobacteria bacterium]
MIASATFLAILVTLALILSIVTPVLLFTFFIRDLKQGTLW